MTTSPSVTRVTRRRSRSARVSVAVGLILIAAVAVLGALLVGVAGLIAAAAAVAVLCGGLAVRIVHLELLDSRVEAARDRALQARGYVAITEARIAENAARTQVLEDRIAAQAERSDHDARLVADLEEALAAAHQRAAEAMKQRAEAMRQADAWLADAEAQLGEADARAAEANLRVHELEIELEATQAELRAVQTLHATLTWEAHTRSHQKPA